MYAVITTGGKQYRVQPGDFVQIEKLEGEVGTQVKFDQVLFINNPEKEGTLLVGAPYLSNASVEGEIVGQGRDKKILIIKKKRRKGYRRTQGHRQFQTQFLVTTVDNGAGEKATLSAADKTKKLSTFHTNLKEKGAPHSKKAPVKKVKKDTTAKKD